MSRKHRSPKTFLEGVEAGIRRRGKALKHQARLEWELDYEDAEGNEIVTLYANPWVGHACIFDFVATGVAHMMIRSKEKACRGRILFRHSCQLVGDYERIVEAVECTIAYACRMDGGDEQTDAAVRAITACWDSTSLRVVDE